MTLNQENSLSKKSIEQFKYIHEKQRAFIACNGPSLNDIKSLDGEIVFALNRGYLNKRLKSKYLVFVDRMLATEFASEIPYHNFDAVFTSKGLYDDKIIYANNVYPIRGRHLKASIHFQTDISRPTYGGGTVTFLAMQIAYYMGIHNLYMIGMDHYRHPNDIKHFIKNYFRMANWNTPKINKIETSYSLAKYRFWRSGRSIYNASTHTYLSKKVLPRINLEDVLG